MNQPLVVNLFAGPGHGKSTTAANLFVKFKTLGVNAELAGEYAKDLTWSRRHHTLADQIYVFGKQHHRIYRLQQDCDLIIADSPILLGLAYTTDYPSFFHQTVKWAFDQYNNINFVLNRTKPYNPKGRNQTESEAESKHYQIGQILHQYNIPFESTTGDDEGAEFIFQTVKKVLDIIP